jgi:hypothetical protein
MAQADEQDGVTAEEAQMTPDRKLNPDMKPEVLLECARKAYKKAAWRWDESRRLPVCDSSLLTLTFDLEELAMQMALQIAMERGGWLFGATSHEFFASRDGSSEDVINAKSKPELLALCVEESMG